MASRAPLRIVTPHAKLVYLLLATLAHLLILGTVWATLSETAAIIGAGPLSALWIGIAVRCFRDPDVEPYAAPRAWWRMTARPTSGFVVAGLILLQAGRVAVTDLPAGDGWLLLPGVVVSVVVAALFLRSSLRLRAGAASRLA